MKLQRRHLVLSTGMMTALGAAEWIRPRHMLIERRPSVDWEHELPTRFGDWRVDTSLPIVLPDPELQGALQAIYSQTVTRTYVASSGARVMLCVAYGVNQSDTTRVHLPEVCYPAQGFEVKSLSVSAYPVLAGASLGVKQLVASLALRIEPISYWMVIGDKHVLSSYSHKLVQLQYGLKGWIPDGLLARVSSLRSDLAAAFQEQARFISDLSQSIKADSARRLLGSANLR